MNSDRSFTPMSARPLPKFTNAKIVEFSTARGYRLHRDIKSFANRLIAIVQPQLWSNLSRAQVRPTCFARLYTSESEDSDSMPSSEAES